MSVLSSLARKTETRIVLVVLDGVGGLPFQGRTELEAASLPNLDSLARDSSCGLAVPVLPGVTPGSGPSHLALFGYDPLEFEISRGALEVYGVGRTLEAGEVGARGNFASVDRDGLVRDRRAGRLSTDENARLCALLNERIGDIDGVFIQFIPGKEHRFVLVLAGENLGPHITDTDPHEDSKHYVESTPVEPGSERSATVVNSLMKTAMRVLSGEQDATGVLLRGFSARPSVPALGDLYHLNAAAVATYPMYKGIAALVGMEIVECEESLEGQVEALRRVFDNHDFFYFHYKDTDMAGEDGDFERKVRLIEEFDRFVGGLRELNPDVLVITGDHSTPCVMKKHSWHPNPFTILSENARMDGARRFTEAECARGCLGVFEAKYAMGLMLAHGGKLDKLGA